MKKLVMAIGMMMTAGAALAATSFAYQGLLRNEKGGASGLGQATIDFKLYTGPTEDAPKWGRTVTVRLGTNGLFNVELSDTAGTAVTGLETAVLDDVIEASEKAGQPLYIGLKVAGSAGEIRPRQKVIPVPMSSYAQNVGQAKGDFKVAGDATVAGNFALSGDKSELIAPKATIAKLETTGESDFKGGLKVSGGTLNVATDVSITGKLQVNSVDVGVPIGCIVMWSGETTKIPAGWGLCDGKTYGSVVSPDLRGRFIVGMNHECTDRELENHPRNTDLADYERGATGGSEKVALTVDEMPKHTHTIKLGQRGIRAESSSAYAPSQQVQDQGHDWSPTSDFTGGSAAHENRPPYFALCFIIKYK